MVSISSSLQQGTQLTQILLHSTRTKNNIISHPSAPHRTHCNQHTKFKSIHSLSPQTHCLRNTRKQVERLRHEGHLEEQSNSDNKKADGNAPPVRERRCL